MFAHITRRNEPGPELEATQLSDLHLDLVHDDDDGWIGSVAFGGLSLLGAESDYFVRRHVAPSPIRPRGFLSHEDYDTQKPAPKHTETFMEREARLVKVRAKRKEKEQRDEESIEADRIRRETVLRRSFTDKAEAERFFEKERQEEREYVRARVDMLNSNTRWRCFKRDGQTVVRLRSIDNREMRFRGLNPKVTQDVQTYVKWVRGEVLENQPVVIFVDGDALEGQS